MPIYFQSALSQYVEGTNLVYNPAIKNTSGATLSAWINAISLPNAENYVFVISTDFWSNARAGIAITSAGAISGRGRCLDADSLQSYNSSNGEIVTGTTYHVAAVFDYSNKQITLYKNGVSLGTSGTLGWGATTTSNTDSTLTMIGGLTSGSYYWNGYVGDVRSYNRVLSSNEILSLYGAVGGDCLVAGLRNRYRTLNLSPGSSVNPEPDYGPMQYNLTRASGTRPTYAESTKLHTYSTRARGL